MPCRENSKIPLEPPGKKFRNAKMVKFEISQGASENKKYEKRVWPWNNFFLSKRPPRPLRGKQKYSHGPPNRKPKYYLREPLRNL
jgi:hypothetical protein